MTLAVAFTPPIAEPASVPEARHARRALPGWFQQPRPQDVHAVLVLLSLTIFDVRVPFVRPALGFWVVFGLPVRLLLAKVEWRSPVLGERVVHAVAVTVLTLIVGGLALNTIGPLLGVDRPLDPLPVNLAVAFTVVALSMWRSDRIVGHRLDSAVVRQAVRSSIRGLTVTGIRIAWPIADSVAIALSALAVLSAVAGANRLNNFSGGGPALVALVLVVIVFGLLLRQRAALREVTLLICIYLMSTALLLATSLRGWQITGHDIQREFRVYEATLEAGRWLPGTFHDAYNACLSITILPTILEQVLNVDPPYVYKVFFQLLFAVTPVGVYLLARRTSQVGTALLGVLFFMAFPTFLSDMPFLDRQEMAFLFLAAALLAVTQHGVAVSHRRLVFAAFAAGAVLSHYSTAYILIGVTALAGVMRMSLEHGERLLPQRMRWLNRRVDDSGATPRRARAVVTMASVLAVLAMVALWTGAVTHTSGQLVQTLSESVAEVFHPGSADSKSSDVGYTLLPSPPVPPQQRLDEAVQTIYQDTAAERTADGDLVARATLDRYPLTVVPNEPLPLTAVGRAMNAVGLDPGTMNTVMRQAAAKLLQVFVLVGLLALAFGYRKRFKPTGEIVLLGVASFAVVVSQVVLPQMSADYGVLRAFQQALMILAPFLATGLLICFRWLRRGGDLIAVAFAMVFLASLIGVLPQLTGGYPAQLQLNNSGDYYDAYYTGDPERAALEWLAGAPEAIDNVQFTALTDRLTTPRLESHLGTSPRDDILPPYLRRSSYVLLDATVVTRRIGVTASAGNTIEYRYPTELLQSARNLVYSNGFAQVYR
jgi:uncharacterized membrane protein